MEEIVQGTNDSSILSKYSMITSGYDEDPFIGYFAQRKVKRAPLINVGYFVRSTIMTNIIKHYCKVSVGETVQIISLGAGFDTTFFKSVSEYNNIRYFEIDLPGVVSRKIEIINRCEILMNKISPSESNIILGKENEWLKSDKYCIFSHDLNLLNGLDKKLKDCNFDFNLPTLLFSECAITYLEEEKSTKLINWSQIRIPKSTFITFEQINPDDAFGQVMISHFIKIQSPLNSVRKYKTIQQQMERYLNCGWPWCYGVSALEMLYNLIPISDLWNILKKEPFDEFEEWHLKCCHYAIIIAANQNYMKLWEEYLTYIISGSVSFSNSTIKTDVSINCEEMTNITVERFGHSLVNISDSTFLVVGGFANQEKRHGRTKNISLIFLSGNNTITANVELNGAFKDEPKWDCMYSTCTRINNNTFLLYGGRTSPLVAVNIRPWLCQLNWSETDKYGTVIPLVQGPANPEKEPTPRWRHSAVLISTGHLLIFGGISKGLKVLDDLWLLKISTDTTSMEEVMCWSEVPCLDNASPPPSFSHSATVDHGIMYLSGGLNSSLHPLDQLWSYQFSKSWTKIVTVPALKPRYGHTSHVTADNKLILLGGVNTSHEYQPGLTIISLNNFTLIEFAPIRSSISTMMLHNHVSVYCQQENSLYIAGGGGNCFSFGTYFNSRLIRLLIP